MDSIRGIEVYVLSKRTIVDSTISASYTKGQDVRYASECAEVRSTFVSLCRPIEMKPTMAKVVVDSTIDLLIWC